MKSKTISFSGMICYLNDFVLSLEEFKEKVVGDIYSEEKGASVQIFHLEYLDDFLAISFSDGSAMPRNPKVWDQSTHKLENNPRNKDQIEPKEYFAIIDFRTSFLWLNNTNKKTLLLGFIQKFFVNKMIVLKDIYDEQDFINCIDTLDGIKICAVPPNIFSDTNSTSKALNDEMYLATKAELSLSYDRINIVDHLRDKISNILKNRVSFQNITISGRDEKGLGMYFNNNLFTRKISLKSAVDDNGMFNSNEVFDKLIAEITKERNEENN